MMPRRSPTLLFAEFLGGFLVWGAQFTIVYMATSVACGRGWTAATVLGIGAVPFLVLATTLVSLALAALPLARAARRRTAGSLGRTEEFMNGTTILVSALSLVAIAYTGLPALIVPVCP